MKISNQLTEEEKEIVLNNWLDFAIEQGEILPAPKENEIRDDFISRCIPQIIRDGTTDDVNQATATCMSIWRRDENGKKNK